jgi:hypothetical protein
VLLRAATDVAAIVLPVLPPAERRAHEAIAAVDAWLRELGDFDAVLDADIAVRTLAVELDDDHQLWWCAAVACCTPDHAGARGWRWSKRRSILRRWISRIVDALDDQPERDPTLIAQAKLLANVSTFDEPLERRLPLGLREPKVRRQEPPGRTATSAWSDIARWYAIQDNKRRSFVGISVPSR